MKRAKGHLTARRFFLTAAACAVLWAVTGFVCLFFGHARISVGDFFFLLGRSAGAARSQEANILLHYRLPRVALALFAGGALAVAGAVFQALLRNPLATPHTLGVSAGGSLGAVIAISFPLPVLRLGPVTAVQLFALLGALGNMGIIYLLARRRQHFSTLKLLLAGVTLGLISSAMIMLVRYLSDPYKLIMVNRWLMGGLDVEGYRSLASVLPFAVPAIAVLFANANTLNQLSFGEELAAGRGVDVGALQRKTFLAGSVLTASVVSVAGPIGFVGLMVPHALRTVLGPDHRTLLFASFFGGGTLLAVADTFARTAFSPSELPVGVLTAMLGGPFFLVLLVTKLR